ncbi:MAG: transglycosylase SLT domain-containing protein [Pseudomonadota bacterium]
MNYSKVLTLSFLVFAGVSASSKVDASADMCLEAAHIASEEMGVPVSVLWAISLTETGRKKSGSFQPWPWTVNMEGKGLWFDSDEEARAYVFKHYKQGARSFDVGCFQINYKWHGENFTSIEQMFEPIPNALYAAKFLADLYRELGDWSKAAGAYHSRTEKYARKYRKRFDALHASFADQVPARPDIPTTPAPVKVAVRTPETTRENRFPFLIESPQRGALGSLVPLNENGAQPFFGQPRG